MIAYMLIADLPRQTNAGNRPRPDKDSGRASRAAGSALRVLGGRHLGSGPSSRRLLPAPSASARAPPCALALGFFLDSCFQLGLRAVISLRRLAAEHCIWDVDLWNNGDGRRGFDGPICHDLGAVGCNGSGRLPPPLAPTRAATRAFPLRRLLGRFERGLVGDGLALDLLDSGLLGGRLGRSGAVLPLVRPRPLLARGLLGHALGGDRGRSGCDVADELRVGHAVENSLDSHLHPLADEARSGPDGDVVAIRFRHARPRVVEPYLEQLDLSLVALRDRAL